MKDLATFFVACRSTFVGVVLAALAIAGCSTEGVISPVLDDQDDPIAVAAADNPLTAAVIEIAGALSPTEIFALSHDFGPPEGSLDAETYPSYKTTLHGYEIIVVDLGESGMELYLLWQYGFRPLRDALLSSVPDPDYVLFAGERDFSTLIPESAGECDEVTGHVLRNSDGTVDVHVHTDDCPA